MVESQIVLPEEIMPRNSVQPEAFVHSVLQDYWIGLVSREASLIARKEVLTGKAKFGITGDGKEVAQLAMARAFKKGDFKAGYYRDQTFMMAIGECSVEDFFAQLYADIDNDRFSSGRQMNNHFCNPLISPEGEWYDQTTQYNLSSDISSTAGQMPRALGHALATKLFRKNADLLSMHNFNDRGDGLTVVTIGDASTSEGPFWETMNAAAVQGVPLATCVYDDGYGISVPVELQTVKGSISKAMEGYYIDEQGRGIHIYIIKGWDYPALIEGFEVGFERCRKTHIPALFHIQEMTQPQGHSTSGSQERYKSKERLAWEDEHDCLKVMAAWMIESGLVDEEYIINLKEKAKEFVKEKRKIAYDRYMEPARQIRQQITALTASLSESAQPWLSATLHELRQPPSEPTISELARIARRLVLLSEAHEHTISGLSEVVDAIYKRFDQPLHTFLYAEGQDSPLNVSCVYPDLSGEEKINGSQVLNRYFDALFASRPEVIAFGEDVGYIGDVNQGMAGLQEKYSENRVFDTGIRECTIIGQAIGLAMRGFRPIAEIQYLDYLTFAMSPLTDDLATLRYRSGGRQAAPAIIRTRGHRLEGIWHAGSPMALLLSSLRGMHICVPRDMTRAVGMYNTLMAGTDPGIVVECLNGYRLKETAPRNLLDYKIELGVPEILQSGDDITVVSYGSCLRVVRESLELIAAYGISVELIDVQTLMPFDRYGVIAESVKKTNKLLVIDEDIPGGASAFILQQVVERDGAYKYLDYKPQTLTAQAHRPPFGSEGDYFSKPNAEDVAQKIIQIMMDYQPLS
jgi:pyruvate/2-oxoglutarate/acetoin dehydrogenase E1 component/TPP-dependent pyruvate/acetoin dehydrogenase alpha subunit